MNHPALRLTPSNSPFFKTPAPRSPTRPKIAEEPGLRLSKVIGTTTTSSNGFDCLPGERKFAYTAGAAAVVASVDRDVNVAQRFFRARPNTAGVGREANGPSVASPAPSEPRSRALRDQSVGASPLSTNRDWSDSPTGRTLTAKDRVKAATSVALSPNGKWLAVGETGYKPTIAIYSLADGSTDTPVTVLAEHTFGVHALRFSPDNKFLASLGAVNDGFLYLWRIDDRTGNATLHASNKCTTLVNSMTWMGSAIATVGLRFVRVWRPEAEHIPEPRRAEATLSPLTPRHRPDNRSSEFNNSILTPRHKVLAGKNSLLGDVLECNFISVLAVSATQSIVCAETGEICILDDTSQGQTLRLAAIADFEIRAARLDPNRVLRVFGDNDRTATFAVEQLEAGPCQLKAGRRRSGPPTKQFRNAHNSLVATACIGSISVTLSQGGSIVLANANSPESGEPAVRYIAGHTDAVTGVLAIASASFPGAAFLTYTGSGAVQLWDARGEALHVVTAPLDAIQDSCGSSNALTSASLLANGTLLATGDRNGVLSIQALDTGSLISQLRAHSAEITDICAFERLGVALLATASRDRTVQLFSWCSGKLDLLQTLDEHAGAVNGLLMTESGNHLLSCSADRSIVIREAWQRNSDDPASLAYVMLRTITVKSAPTSICIGSDPDALLVATMDRMISKYDITTGMPSTSFKCTDGEGGEAVALVKILLLPSAGGRSSIVGVSSTDKSVRLYSELGTLIARDWGHTEGTTGAALLASGSNAESELAAAQLVTVAADSTIFLWDTRPAVAAARAQDEATALDAATPRPSFTGPPLRKVMSHSELSRFRRESTQEEIETASPITLHTPTQSTSPQRLRKKPSRMNVAQAPRLEPAFRSSFAEPITRQSRRRSLRASSPSPPSPRNVAKRDTLRRPSLGVSMRSRSSDNMINTLNTPSTASGFGSINSSTESVYRTLRSYRKKLANAPASESLAPETLRELEKELKLTARVLNEKSQGKTLDEAMMARLLDQASEKIVGMLDERIKERVESEVRRSNEGSPLNGSFSRQVSLGEGSDALAGALEKVALADET